MRTGMFFIKFFPTLVNLPAKNKMTTPGYQAILNKDIPAIVVPDGSGMVRVIAGNYQGHAGPARTFTPMNVWDLRLNPRKTTEFSLTDSWNVALIILHGTVSINGDTLGKEAQAVVLDQTGNRISLEAQDNAVVLLLSGEPIDEPIVGQGPFVMNSQAEIDQAMADFESGSFGQISR